MCLAARMLAPPGAKEWRRLVLLRGVKESVSPLDQQDRQAPGGQPTRVYVYNRRCEATKPAQLQGPAKLLCFPWANEG